MTSNPAPKTPTAQPETNAPAIRLVRPESHWIIEPAQEGVIFVRSQSAEEPEPSDWRQRLTEALRATPRCTVMGAKRLLNEPRCVFSMGEFVVHPKGFHHLGRGVDQRAYRFPEEVDAVASGVFAVDADAFDQVDGQTLLQGQLGGLNLGLAMRQADKRVVVSPSVIVADAFTPTDDPDDRRAFHDRWKFDWISADLNDVQTHYAQTGMLWNVRFFGTAMPFEKYGDRPSLVWKSYREVEVFRQRAAHLADLAQKITPEGNLLDIGCGDGLFSHLYAMKGIEVVGVDPEPLGVKQAQQNTAGQTYPAKAPVFMEGRGDDLPFEDGSFNAVTLLDVIEHLPNPIVVLKEIARVLKVGGMTHICTPSWQFGGSSDAVYHLHEYTLEELARQINAVEGMKVVHTGMIGGVYRDLVVLAQKLS